MPNYDEQMIAATEYAEVLSAERAAIAQARMRIKQAQGVIAGLPKQYAGVIAASAGPNAEHFAGLEKTRVELAKEADSEVEAAEAAAVTRKEAAEAAVKPVVETK